MSIIIDLKDAIRASIHALDSGVNFNFEKIQTVTYPYVFFYISSYKVTEHIETIRDSLVSLSCVLEYVPSGEPTNSSLWNYEAKFREATKNFPFLDTKLHAINPEFEIVDDALQMRFDLQFYVKDVDETELMKELDLTLKEA